MRGALRVVPWTGLPEWTRVARCVGEHGHDREALLEALDWLRIWVIRGNAPPAVETTYSLLEIKRCMWDAVRREEEEEEEGEGEEFGRETSSRCLQLSLAAALVRFVNEVVDPEQQGVFAQPVTHLAERMNLPRLLVDIRHGATHDELPSYEVLALGLELALNWLREHYWCPQAAWTGAVRESAERAIARFLAALKEADPLTKPPLMVAARCLHEVPQVETSFEVQVPFVETILQSTCPLSEVLPMLGAVLRQNDMAMVALVTVVLSLPETDQRALSAIDYGAGLIESEATLAICARDCLKRLTVHGRALLQRILANLRIPIAPELKELIDLLMSATSSQPVHSPGDLISRTEQLLGEHQRRLQETEQAVSLACGWYSPQDWKPRPWGVTEHFNPITDFRSLVGPND